MLEVEVQASQEAHEQLATIFNSEEAPSNFLQLLNAAADDPELVDVEQDVREALASRLEVQVRALQMQVDCMSCELQAVKSQATTMRQGDASQDIPAATDQLLRTVADLQNDLEAAASDANSARAATCMVRAGSPYTNCRVPPS